MNWGSRKKRYRFWLAMMIVFALLAARPAESENLKRQIFKLSGADKTQKNPPMLIDVGLEAKKPRGDSWLTADKFDHFLFSAMFSGSAFLAQRVTGEEVKRATVLSFSAVASLGILKELYDILSPRGQASWRDLSVDFAGALAGVLLVRCL